MRVLILSEAKTFHARRWAGALADRGHTVWLLSRSSATIPGVTVLPLRIPPWSLRYPGRWHARYENYVRDTIRELGPDLVHVHFLEDHPLANQALGDARLVISTWGSDVVRSADEPPEPEAKRCRKVDLLRQADRVTATTHHLAEQTAAYARLDKRDIAVIPFGVDLSRFKPRRPGGPDDSSKVLFLKHLYPVYGPAILLDALPRIRAACPNLRASIVGDGPLRPRLERRARKLNLTGILDWHGAVEHDRVPNLMNDHDVYVMPSLRESFGVSAVEAQAAGLPVVGSDLPGVREAVRDGVGGLLVPPRNVDALANAVIRLLHDPDLSRRMGRAGRAFVAQRFDWHRNVSAMESVYQNLLAGQPALAHG